MSLRSWWRPQMRSENVGPRDEYGYGQVVLRGPKCTLPQRVRLWRSRRRPKQPTTIHLGWEDESGEFHEVDAWKLD